MEKGISSMVKWVWATGDSASSMWTVVPNLSATKTGASRLFLMVKSTTSSNYERNLKYAGHKFATRSDTEVIVHAYEQWGKKCVTTLQRDVCLCLWDSNRRELFLARDHLGIKPLYYVKLGNRILFASEIKALLQYQHVLEISTSRHWRSFLHSGMCHPRRPFLKASASCRKVTRMTLSRKGHRGGAVLGLGTSSPGDL